MPPLKKTLKAFVGEIWWIGNFSKEYFFQYLTCINLDTVNRINILTTYSQADKDFLLHLKAFWDYCQEKIVSKKTVINVKIFLPNAEPADKVEICIFDENTGFECSGKNLRSINKLDPMDAQRIRELKTIYTNALTISGLDDILRIKIESDYGINSRSIPDKIKTQLLDGLIAFEKSNQETGIFELIGIYERYAREFMKYRLQKRAPVKWYKKYVEANMKPNDLQRINKIFREDIRKEAEHISNVSNPLQYYDCKNYPILIENIQKTNAPLFAGVTTILISDMKKVPGYRNPVSHHREGFLKDAIPLVIGILVELHRIEDLNKFQ